MHVLAMTHVRRSEDNMRASVLSFDHVGSEIKFKSNSSCQTWKPVTGPSHSFLVSFITHILDEAVK